MSAARCQFQETSILTVSQLSLEKTLYWWWKPQLTRTTPKQTCSSSHCQKYRPCFHYMLNGSMFVLILFCISQDLSSVWPSDQPCFQHSVRKPRVVGSFSMLSLPVFLRGLRCYCKSFMWDCTKVTLQLWGGDTLRTCWGSTSCKRWLTAQPWVREQELGQQTSTPRITQKASLKGLWKK